MAQIATQSVTLAGTAPTFTPAAAGDAAATGPGMKLIVKNGAGFTITATLLVPGLTVNGIAKPDTPYTIVAGGAAWIPLYDFYRDTDGLAHVTYSSITSVTRAVVAG